jgi:peptidoglycan/LPS O-acetylase OafA/YrhL
MAVDFFFVLSGFIMSYTYAASFLSGRPGAYADFLGRRVARIVPLHVAVILLVTALAAVSVAVSGANIFFDTTSFPADFIANLLLLPGLGFGANFNGPSWSISTEIVAYLLFPLLVACMFSRSRLLTAASAGAALFFLVLLAAQTPRLELSYDGSPESLVRCLTEFSLGMLAYRAYASGRFRVLATDGAAFGLVAACIVSLLLRIDLPAALMFPPLVLAFATNRGRAGRLMEMRIPYFLGVISYSIYLIHNPLRPIESEVVQWALGTNLPRWEAVVFAIAGTISVVPFAWAAFELVERPGRSFVRRLIAAKAAAGKGGSQRRSPAAHPPNPASTRP